MKRYIVRFAMLLILLTGTNIASFADPEPNEDPQTNDAPLDGGLSILIAAGVGYGAKKMHGARKRVPKRNK
jgi:glucose uptake protein GlcU